MTENVVKTTVAIVVSVIVFAAILVPAISAAQKDLTTEHIYVSENPRANLDKLEITDSHVLTWADSTLTIDDVVYPLNADGSYIPFLTENVALYVSGGNLYLGQATQTQISLSSKTLSLIASAGEITYSIDDADAIQTTYTMGYILDNDGKYISGSVDSGKKYFTSNSQVSGYRTDSSTMYVMIDGNSFTNGTHVSDFTIDSHNAEGTDGEIKELDAVRYSGRGLTAFIVLDQVSYITEDNPVAISLLGALPIIVIAGLIVGIAGTLFIRKNGD